MQPLKKTIDELMSDYATALSDYGLAYSSQLRLLQRAGAIAHWHIRKGSQYLNEDYISSYYQEFDKRFYNGEMSKTHNQTIHREIDRFLYFTRTGNLKMPYPLKGPKSTILPEFKRIVDMYLASGDYHENTHAEI